MLPHTVPGRGRQETPEDNRKIIASGKGKIKLKKPRNVRHFRALVSYKRSFRRELRRRATEVEVVNVNIQAGGRAASRFGVLPLPRPASERARFRKEKTGRKKYF